MRKIVFESSLDLYFHQEEIQTNAVVDICSMCVWDFLKLFLLVGSNDLLRGRVFLVQLEVGRNYDGSRFMGASYVHGSRTYL